MSGMLEDRMAGLAGGGKMVRIEGWGLGWGLGLGLRMRRRSGWRVCRMGDEVDMDTPK